LCEVFLEKGDNLYETFEKGDNSYEAYYNRDHSCAIHILQIITKKRIGFI
jgi:hypothetical protein